MHEKLNEQIEAMDEKVAKIANACLDNIQKAFEQDKDISSSGVEAATVKLVGESLKALAEGLESYRIMTKNIKNSADRQQ
jgi:DNA-binding ferritin-like protein